MNYGFIRYTLSRLLQIEAGLLLLPLLVSVIYQEPVENIQAFVLTVACIFIFSLLLGHRSSGKTQIYEREGLLIVALSWILLSIFGALPFYFSGQIPRYVDALFETVSGFTTTGSTILTDVESLSHSMLFWRSFAHLIGGMGILVFALAILPKMGGGMRIMRAEVPGPEFGKIVARTSLSARILYLMYLSMTAVLIILLMLGGLNLFDAMIHAFGAAGTGGFSNYNASVGHFGSAYIEIVLGVGMLAFGINFTLYYYVLVGHWKEVLRNEELRWYLAIMGLGTFAIAFNSATHFPTFSETLRHSFFTASSIMTTTGYTTVDFGLWPLFSHLILMGFMVIGASSGSTGGGLKVTRLRTVIHSSILEIFHVREPKRVMSMRQGSRAVEPNVVRSVFNYLGLYMMLIVGMTLLISLEQNDFSSALGAVLATFNNIGPGLGVYGPVSNYSSLTDASKILLTFSMLAGRLEMYPILILFSRRTWRNTL
ncbi:MAG TPA: TrkH family potassium uptake protein [Tissierellia bacterium]|jgi:trk system potassium uptake protein TrkH|nr:TrkH family potassium uptake protein [Tissierellia bacterium]